LRVGSALGRHELALTHGKWATVFAPDDDRYATLYGYRLIASGQVRQAEEAARDYLARHPSSGPVRLMLAYALALGSAGRPPDPRQALEVLQPLLDPVHADPQQRAAALVVSQELHRQLGRHTEAGQLGRAID